MKKVDYDKVIKDFFSNVLFLLRFEIDKPGADKKAIQHNISCMLMFKCNPAKFTKLKQMEANELFVTPDGLGDELFCVVRQMIAVVRGHYDVNAKGVLGSGKLISELYKQSKLIMFKNNPIQTIRMLTNKKIVKENAQMGVF